MLHITPEGRCCAAIRTHAALLGYKRDGQASLARRNFVYEWPPRPACIPLRDASIIAPRCHYRRWQTISAL